MKKRLLFALLFGLFLAGCQMRFGGPRTGGVPTGSFLTPTSTADLPTEAPSPTLAPPPTITPTARPDLSVIGLPTEAVGTTAYDFASDLCSAEWYNNNASVPCNGQDSASTSGYVAQLDGSTQGLPPSIGLLLMYPPQGSSDTLSGKYPPFAVQKGDRFRAVLACRGKYFCDVEFGLDYYDANGHTGLKHWSYLFANPPLVVDYPLDGIAGLTVQFTLSVRRHGVGQQAYSVWIAPHIYRP